MSDEPPKPPIRIMNYEYKLYHTPDGTAAREYIEHIERQLKDEREMREFWENKCREWHDAYDKVRQ